MNTIDCETTQIESCSSNHCLLQTGFLQWVPHQDPWQKPSEAAVDSEQRILMRVHEYDHITPSSNLFTGFRSHSGLSLPPHSPVHLWWRPLPQHQLLHFPPFCFSISPEAPQGPRLSAQLLPVCGIHSQDTGCGCFQIQCLYVVLNSAIDRHPWQDCTLHFLQI